MSLATGTMLGPYEVMAPLGAGGMGEVYRARDTRLGRDVAVKVLPEDFAADPDRRARFEREARAVAALSHPNILAVFDTGVHDPSTSSARSSQEISSRSGPAGSGQTIVYVVTELLDGETLRDRLQAGALPVRKAGEIAVQIARGLAAAHDKKIVHRDLKPENVFLLKDGQVKILDFGLARQMAAGTGATETVSAVTDPGTVMGTVGYMAPEQVRGQEVDARADLFAFGAVLYEMLSGRRAFRRDTVADTMTAILNEDPLDLSGLRPDLPSSLDRLVRHCLEKNSAERFQSARDVAFALGEVSGSGPLSSGQIARRAALAPSRWRDRLGIVTLCLLTVALAWTGWRLSRPATAPVVVQFIQPPPEDMSIGHGPLGPPGAIAVSPDGSRIAFVAFAGGTPSLWVRRLDEPIIKRIEGTTGPLYPFWSADNQFLAFCDSGKLKKVPRDGGTPQPIAECPNPRTAGVWARDGTIIFVPAYDGPVVRLSASRMTTAEALSVHAPTGWMRHLVLLPDGERFLFVLRGTATNGEGDGVFVGSMRSPDTELLFKGRSNGLALARGSIFFTRNGTLLSAPFDSGSATLTGDVTQIASKVAAFSASEGGTLAYFATPRGINLSQRIAWFNRDGTLIKTTGEPGSMIDPRISPDGLQVAVGRRDEGGVAELWTYDIARDSGTRVTFTGGIEPVWSPRDRSLLYVCGAGSINRVSLSGDGSDGPMPGMPMGGYPDVEDWSRDKQFVAFRTGLPQSGDLQIAPADGGTAIPIANTSFNEKDGRFSPDSRWFAYSSNESGSGRFEIYVKPVPGPGRGTKASTDGGQFPVWGPDGQEIYYRGRGSMLMAVPVNGRGNTFGVGTPRSLFKMMGVAYNFLFDTDDGKRFVMIVDGERDPSPITVVVNWTLPKR